MAFVPKYTQMPTEEQKKQAQEIRFKQMQYMKATKFSDAAKNWKLEAHATFYESVAKYQPKSLSGGISRKIASTAESYVSKDDMGSETAGGIIKAGIITADTYRVTKGVVKASTELPKNVSKATVELGKSAVTIKRSVESATKTVKAAASSYKAIQSSSDKTKFVAKTVKDAASYGVSQSVNAVGKSVVHGAVKGAVKAKNVYIPKAVDAVTLGTGSVLSSSDDDMVSTTGKTVTATTYAVKTAEKGVQTVGNAVKTTSKAGIKTAGKAAKKTTKTVATTVAKEGTKKTAKVAIQEAGKSVVSAVIATVKESSTGYYSLIIILIIVLAIVVSVVITSLILIVGSWFSGSFDAEDEAGVVSQMDVSEYVSDYVSQLRQEYINNVKSIAEYKLSNESYNYAKVNLVGIDTYDLSFSDIDASFYSEDTISNTLQPIFNAILLMDYELSVTEQEAKDIVKNLFDTIFSYTEVTETSVCITNAAPCGVKHARADCYNVVKEYHTAYTCDSCDSYVCHGHVQETVKMVCDGHDREWKICQGHLYGNAEKGDTYTYFHNDGKEIYSTDESFNFCDNYILWGGRLYCDEAAFPYCDNKKEERLQETLYCTDNKVACSNSTFKCDGHALCGGHKVYKMTISMDGLDKLIDKHFTKPIHDLEEKDTLTEQEIQQLQNLKDYYEILLIMLETMNDSDNENNVSVTELKNISWVESSRTGCEDVVNLAVSQIGRYGGETYWRYCGYDTRIPWSECFVFWVMEQTGNGKKYAYDIERGDCKTVNAWFHVSGVTGTANKEYRDMTKGDVAFLDSNFDGKVEQIGIVLGRDEEYVYLVVGDNGDMVRCMKYPFDSNNIIEYGLIRY